MEKIKLLGIYGAGGCGRGIAPLLQRHFRMNVSICFIDDYIKIKKINKIECMNLKTFLKKKVKKKIIIAIADPLIRKSIYLKLKKFKIKFFEFFDDRSINFQNNRIDEGYLVSPFVTIASNVKIGKQFHANLYSYVEHDSQIGNFVTFAPGAKCNGNVIIGNNVLVGSGAVIKNGTKKNPLRIGSNVTIGAGSVVTKNVQSNLIICGNPAKKLEKK